MLSKKLQKIVDKTSPEFSRKVYFSKKYRDKLRNDFIRLREAAVKELENASRSRTLKESKDRLLAESFLDISIKYIKFCDTAEKQQIFYNQRGKFILFKKGDDYVFNMKTLRGKKIREGNLNFKGGLPTKKKTHAVLRKEILKTDGYEEIDSGKYHLKQLSFENGYYHYWGRGTKYFINFNIEKAISKKIIAIICKNQ